MKIMIWHELFHENVVDVAKYLSRKRKISLCPKNWESLAIMWASRLISQNAIFSSTIINAIEFLNEYSKNLVYADKYIELVLKESKYIQMVLKSTTLIKELIYFWGIPEPAFSLRMLQRCLIRCTLIAIYMRTLQISPPSLPSHVTIASKFLFACYLTVPCV